MGYLVAAYGLVWTLMTLYLVFLQRQQRRLNDQLAAMTREAEATGSREKG